MASDKDGPTRFVALTTELRVTVARGSPSGVAGSVSFELSGRNGTEPRPSDLGCCRGADP